MLDVCGVMSSLITSYNDFSEIPFVGLRGYSARCVLEYLLNHIVRDKGILFENDTTPVDSKDISILDSDFCDIYNVLYRTDLSFRNYNIVLRSRLDDCVYYARIPSNRHVFYANKVIGLKWTVYTTSKLVEVPLAVFVLMSGKVGDIQALLDLVLALPKQYDLHLFPDVFIFLKEFEKTVRDILTMPKEIPYPTEAYRYLHSVRG